MIQKFLFFFNFILKKFKFKKNETGEVDAFIEYLIQECLTTMIKFQQHNNNQSKIQQQQQTNAITNIQNDKTFTFDQIRIESCNSILPKHSINIHQKQKQSKVTLFGQSQETQLDSNENDTFDMFTQNEYCLIESTDFGLKKPKQIKEETENKLTSINSIQVSSKKSLEEKKSKALLHSMSDFKEIDKQIIDIYNKFLQSIEYQNILNVCSLFFGVSKVTYFCGNCKKSDDHLNDINLFKIIKLYDDSEYTLQDRIVQTGFFQYCYCKSCKMETKFLQKLVFYSLPKYLFISIQKQSNYKLQFCSSSIQPVPQNSMSKKTVKSMLDSEQIQIETIYQNQARYSLKGQILNQQGSPKFTSLIQQSNTKEEQIIYLYSDQIFKQRNKFASENVKIVIYERIDV